MLFQGSNYPLTFREMRDANAGFAKKKQYFNKKCEAKKQNLNNKIIKRKTKYKNKEQSQG